MDDLYERLADRGLAYGPAFRGLQAAWQHGDDIYADVALPESAVSDGETSGFLLHPALLDAALHVNAAHAATSASGGTLLPFAWTGVKVHAVGAAAVRVRLSPAQPEGVTLRLADGLGNPVATVSSLVSRPVTAGGTPGNAAPAHLFRVEWTSVALPETARDSTAPAADWAVFGAAPDIPSPLIDALTTAAAASPGTVSRYADLDDLPVTVPAVVLLDRSYGDGLGTDLPSAARHATNEVLTVIRRWLADDRFTSSRLVVVTRGAVAIGDEADLRDLAHAAALGLLRSAQAEHPDRFTLVDIDGSDAAGMLSAALDTDEPQLALRGATAFAPRLDRASTTGLLVPPVGVGVGAWRVEAGGSGSLGDLSLVPCDAGSRVLAAGEVRVGVRAAGVNFRDVLISLGMYPDKSALLGGEAAGVVLEVGREVPGLKRGDRVMGLFTGAFGPVAVADHRMLVRIPKGWSFTRAASVPAVFLTALYALSDLGGVGAGDRVLVHAAAGGVGMAAVQLARHLGAEVWATASKAKWETVRALGVAADHLASSRDTGFGRQFTEVDVVLNSLVGELVDTSLDLLGPGGRFVEMGKADVRDADDLAARGITYRAFDLAEAGPDRIQQMLQE
ncbi:polyketide synthase dehydratase domain-containing protein, partial [Streptomyces sp. NPDC007851]|uniref:polyketide synthase dehydratase domain-containing protein n=1 Tax=Streptomyces sp. NPDC007851 TaxID=3155008 RepID=UPI0033D727DD